MIIHDLPTYINPNISPQYNLLLDTCVRASLGFELKDLKRNSIASLGKSNLMNPECDSFKLLAFELMSITLRNKYFGDRDKV